MLACAYRSKPQLAVNSLMHSSIMGYSPETGSVLKNSPGSSDGGSSWMVVNSETIVERNVVPHR